MLRRSSRAQAKGSQVGGTQKLKSSKPDPDLQDSPPKGLAKTPQKAIQQQREYRATKAAANLLTQLQQTPALKQRPKQRPNMSGKGKGSRRDDSGFVRDDDEDPDRVEFVLGD